MRKNAIAITSYFNDLAPHLYSAKRVNYRIATSTKKPRVSGADLAAMLAWLFPAFGLGYG